ncbi:DUF5689 domain-containing protein [Pedobacter lusitanus]|uniref:DUF5689 domain-containing protein n=1 Tax=Pedobacter lusitanus TaxID=1503925 RepID=UPI000696C9FC|nr:DUF5689 domain-containing protein [Pedobacter lusitanus]
MNKYIFQLLSCWILLTGLAGCKKHDSALGDPSPIIALEDLRAVYQGSDVSLNTSNLAGAHQIIGVVVSDGSSGNMPAGTVAMQNNRRNKTRGILLAVENAAALQTGDSIVVDINGTTLKKVNGSLQVTGLNAASVTKVSSGNSRKPITVTTALFKAKPDDYEGTLVRIFSGSIIPVPVAGELYAGDKSLSDNGGAMILHTEKSAAFAGKGLPASATFTGIPLMYQPEGKGDAVPSLWPRNIQDMLDASGPIYNGFPETFEFPDQSLKASYAAAVAALKTGSWLLDQAILANTSGRDRFNPAGFQCIRMQQNLTVPGYVQMNFNVPNGASKVSLLYGSYYNDASSSFVLEYSKDDGLSWVQTGKVINDASAVAKTATFLMDITGPVRFRVKKLGLGTTNNTSINNGRLSIEDFAIYAN